MTDWIPLLQTLVWPVFIAVLAIRFRRPLRRLVDAVNSRVEQGDSFEAGTSGIRLGPSSPPGPSGPEPRPGAQPALDSAVATESRPPSTSTAPGIHVVHTAHRDRSLDNGGYRYYRIRVFLEGDADSDLDRVAKVVYHLHPTFYQPERTITDRATNFELTTAAWGMFAVQADVYLTGRREPVRLERYINF